MQNAEVFTTNGEASDAFTALSIPAKYHGMERFAARKAIVAEFEELGLLTNQRSRSNKFLTVTVVAWLSNQC